ncbi:MAG: undecaprenyl-diphosphate phosphatase [Nitrospirota bacterium]
MTEAIILGIVQGLTEFFPVSSTAHLILLPWFFTWSGLVDTLTFDIALHAGTLFALIICFWKDWLEIIFKKRRLLWFVIIATLPAGISGVLLNDIVENSLRSPYIICISLILIGFLMLASEKTYKHKKTDEINLYDAIIIGFSQAIALIPGVSRSGITISSGLFRGLDRESSARFSFLLSTPVIAGAVLLHIKNIINGTIGNNLELFVAGFTASALTGFFAIKFLLYFFRKYPLNIFVYYRFMLAVVIIIGIWLKG